MSECDSCAYKGTCKIKSIMPGKHRVIECDMYFPDLSEQKVRGPKKIRTPEDRRKDMETRD